MAISRAATTAGAHTEDSSPALQFAGSSTFCVTAGFTYPLTIPFAISDTFGPRLIRRYDFHRGLDWTDYTTTAVRAVTTGTVRFFRGNYTATMGTGSGNFVHLSHEDIGCETRYSHLAEVSEEITNGLVVTPGQIIGWVGDTGASYPHLHFEVRQGINVTQRAAIHPLSTPFLPWTNTVTPTVNLLGVYPDATGLTALVEVTTPYTEPDVVRVSVAVSGAVTDSRVIDYIDLNANTTVVDHLDDPCVNDVCMIPVDLNAANDYRVIMVFSGLQHGPTATVTARVFDVGGWHSTATATLTSGLEVTPPEQIARGVPGQTVTLVYTLTNYGASDTFTLTHLSAQGWPATVTPATVTLPNGASIAATVEITLDTESFGPPDYGLLSVTSQNNPQHVAAGFYRIYRDAYVSATGNDTTECGSMSEPCATITYALSRTAAGGTIHVAQGTYTENLVLKKTVNLLGGYASEWSTRSLAAYATVVDGGGNNAVLTVDGDYGPLIEGFTFTNGYRYDGGGGGVRFVGSAAPTLRFNWILNNTADKSGGGIYIGSYGTLSPTIISNTIAGNTSKSTSGGGGGIYIKDRPVLIQGNVISNNSAVSKAGGGIYLTGDTIAQVLNNRIQYNTAASSGGGVRIYGNAAPTLYDNHILNNTAGKSGGGIFIGGTGMSSPTIISNTIAGNTSNSDSGGGGGIYIKDRSVLIQGNVISGNQSIHNGGGVYLTNTPFQVFLPIILKNANALGASVEVWPNIDTAERISSSYVTNRLVLLQSNVISANQAEHDAGGIYFAAYAKAQVLANRILGNVATNDGGGVLVRSSNVSFADNLIRNNKAGKHGHGVRVASSSAPCLCHNTLLANHPDNGEGLFIGAGSTPVICNNIIATHAVGVHYDGAGARTIHFNLLNNTTNYSGPITGPDDIIADPHLCDEVHLASDSPAIDAGQATSICTPVMDIDGQTRLGVGDIGADEFMDDCFK